MGQQQRAKQQMEKTHQQQIEKKLAKVKNYQKKN